MSANVQRGLHLYQLNRYGDAENEFRQAIGENPQDHYARALLALALAHQQRFKDADGEINEALKADPGDSFVHYAKAFVLNERERFSEAQAAVQEAIQLSPEDADYHSLQSQIFLNQRQWQQALNAAEIGLQMDAEHVGCANLRAIALVKLGRRDEAGQTIDSALAKNPENSLTHANQGWTLLHSGDHKKALEHFRESLRLDPENEWARQGMIEALKARYFLYSILLRYFLWMSRLSSQAQWGVIFIGFLGNRMLATTAKAMPDLAPFINVIRIIYFAFVFLTWTADPLFNLLLRLNKFGRMVLTRAEIIASNWVGGFVGLAILCLVLGMSVHGPYLIGAGVFGFSVIPLAAIFKCQPGWPKTTMIAYTAVVAGGGIVAFLLSLFPTSDDVLVQEKLKSIRGMSLLLFFIGIIASTWIGNLVATQRARK